MLNCNMAITLTIPPSSTTGNVVLTSGYHSGYGAVPVTAGGIFNGATTTWASSAIVTGTNGTTTNGALQVQGDTEIHGKLKVQGVDISKVLETIQDRLAILVPDPARLEKFEALKQAYDHYKTLEALCVDETNSDK